MKYLTLLLLLGLISSIVAAPTRPGKGKYVRKVAEENEDESVESDEADDISAEEFGPESPPHPPANFVRPTPQVSGPVYTASPNLLGRFNWAGLWGNKNKQWENNQGPPPTKQFRRFRDDESDEEEEDDDEDFDDIENDMYADDNEEVNSDLEYSPPESPPTATDETSSFRSHPFFVSSSGRSRSSSSPPQIMRVRRVTPMPSSYNRMPVRMSSQPMYQYQRRPSMNSMPYRRVQSPMVVPMYPVRRTTPMRMPMMTRRQQQVPVMYYKMRPSSSSMKTQMPMQYYAVRQRKTRN